MRAMDDFHQRVALARELDEVKRQLAKDAEGRLICMAESGWNSLTSSTLNFLLDHNGNVMEKRRKAEIDATINTGRR